MAILEEKGLSTKSIGPAEKIAQEIEKLYCEVVGLFEKMEDKLRIVSIRNPTPEGAGNSVMEEYPPIFAEYRERLSSLRGKIEDCHVLIDQVRL